MFTHRYYGWVVEVQLNVQTFLVKILNRPIEGGIILVGKALRLLYKHHLDATSVLEHHFEVLILRHDATFFLVCLVKASPFVLINLDHLVALLVVDFVFKLYIYFALDRDGKNVRYWKSLIDSQSFLFCFIVLF